MKRVGIILLVLLVVLSFIGLAMAAEKPAAKPAEKKAAEKPKEMEHKGTISKIDEKAKTFTVKDEKGKETTMVVEDMKMLAGLKVGDKVTCKHVVKGKKNICKGVTKEAAPPAKPAEKPAAKPAEKPKGKQPALGC
ncbi:MAG: hypothetical protein HZA07_03840 [Nitrospirae bacterium]|nr:hypothetical protein [Nitrospirota bacterium]